MQRTADIQQRWEEIELPPDYACENRSNGRQYAFFAYPKHVFKSCLISYQVKAKSALVRRPRIHSPVLVTLLLIRWLRHRHQSHCQSPISTFPQMSRSVCYDAISLQKKSFPPSGLPRNHAVFHGGNSIIIIIITIILLLRITSCSGESDIIVWELCRLWAPFQLGLPLSP